jgi:tRNA threonylcarbamoyladenosine biosynthesis protein TsaE
VSTDTLAHALLEALRASDGRLFSEAELLDWGRSLGRVLVPGDVVTLSGDLGAGKTTLARAVCAGYGVTEDVTSPTFAIVHAYTAPKSAVYHVDLYRLSGATDLQNIGWDDLMRDGVLIVEWPERAANAMPARRIALELRTPGRDAAHRVLAVAADAGARR